MSISNMEEIIVRALKVIRSKPEWLSYVKNFNDDTKGFLLANNQHINELKTAIDNENPVHSGASLAMCLQECRKLLNQPVEELATPHYRIFH
jgi:hypothetical protein